MKIAMVLIGEAFRLGGQGTRNRDSEASYDQQKKACESQIRFAESLTQKGFCVDLFVESYYTKYEQDLRNWYGDRLKNCSLRKELVGLPVLGREGISKIQGYDCVFLCRIDLRLKDMFSEVFDPAWQKVMFPSVCWLFDRRCGRFPRVSDTMLFVPSRFLNSIKHSFSLFHDSWAHYVNSGTLKNEDLGLMLNTYHDSDSAKDYNPIYAISNRPESKIWHSMGCEIGEDLMPKQNWGARKFPDWCPKEMMRKDKQFSGDMWEWWHKDQLADIFRFISLIQFEESGRVGYYDHRDQRYWRMDEESMMIMDENKMVSSVMNKVSEEIYSGKYEFDNRVDFMIRKAKPEDWSA